MFYLVGLGGAGSRIADRFYKKDIVGSLISRISKREEGRFVGIAADTSENISHLRSIPQENRVLIGRSRAKGHGTGGDVGMGRKIMEEESSLVLNTVAKATVRKPEAVFILAGLGGGTGTGGCKRLAEKLKKAYGVPVIGIFVLPSRVEGAHYMKNTSTGIAKILDGVDGSLLFDSDVLTSRGEDVLGAHRIIDEAIFSILGAFDEEILKSFVGSISAGGFFRTTSGHVLAKDVLVGMLKDWIYFRVEAGGAEGITMFARGDVPRLCGRDVAEKWCKKHFGIGMRYALQEVDGANYLQVVTVIRGIKDIKKRLDEIQTDVKEEKRSGIEELLKDIKPVL